MGAKGERTGDKKHQGKEWNVRGGREGVRKKRLLNRHLKNTWELAICRRHFWRKHCRERGQPVQRSLVRTKPGTLEKAEGGNQLLLSMDYSTTNLSGLKAQSVISSQFCGLAVLVWLSWMVLSRVWWELMAPKEWDSLRWLHSGIGAGCWLDFCLARWSLTFKEASSFFFFFAQTLIAAERASVVAASSLKLWLYSPSPAPLPLSTYQSRSQGQDEPKEWRSKWHLLLGVMAKSHWKQHFGRVGWIPVAIFPLPTARGREEGKVESNWGLITCEFWFSRLCQDNTLQILASYIRISLRIVGNRLPKWILWILCNRKLSGY